MNATIVRMKKEAQALFWPWCVITGATLSVLLPHAYAEPVKALVLGIGSPLLATLSLGNEFQHRTLAVWLSQPAGRMRLWGEKMAVLVPAVLSAGLAWWIGAFGWNWHLDFERGLVLAYVIVTLASATFWTFTARSIINGLFLNVLLQSLVFWTVAGVIARTPDLPRALEAVEKTFSGTFLAAFTLLYSALMLWLGARKLARFQLTGARVGDDLLMSGPSVMPEALAQWFRCRPSDAMLNLVRKELRLLRPLWLLELLLLAYLIMLAMLRLLPAPRENVLVAALAPVVVLLWLIPVLAGALPMGEERTSGTHAWHLTLPVSARRQWLIKLLVSVLSAVTCALLLPLLVLVVAGWLSGSAFMYVSVVDIKVWFLVIPLVALASLWCACAVNGTVRAVLWVFPVMIAIVFANSGGAWLGHQLAETTGTAQALVFSFLHLNPMRSFHIFGDPPLLLAPAVLIGIIQSYRLFRTQPGDSISWPIRCVLPLLIVTLLLSFFLPAVFAVSPKFQPLWDTTSAVGKLHPDSKVELTGEDLGQKMRLSPLTRRWLRGSNIVVVPTKFRVPWPYMERGGSASPGYHITVHLTSGLECRMGGVHVGTMFWEAGGPPSCAYNDGAR